MTFSEVCERIKQIIKEIFSAHKDLEEKLLVSSQKIHQSVNLLREGVKGVAGLVIKYYPYSKSILKYQQQDIIWHEEHGLAIKMGNGEIKPFSVESGDFSVESLAANIKGHLEGTLNRINQQRTEAEKRSKELENAIKILQQLD